MSNLSYMITDHSIETTISLSLTPYSGAWTKAEAAHLLRRTNFGPTNQQILDAVSSGMNNTVTALLQIPSINPPLTYDPNEIVASYGSTWVNSVYPSDSAQNQATEGARQKSLGAWMMKRINVESLSIAEKMCFFWQNHFGVSAASDARATYNYAMLVRQHALGNFKQLVKDLTIDPAMLLFLNGATNTLYSPNENYARELLELFTIGKGPQIGIGDYTHYTEADVAAGAKILTGFLVDGLRSDTLTTPVSNFTPILHDSSTKQLSVHFGNATINNNGANEYADYIDVIFSQPHVATHICTKLYRYFVNYDITNDVQTNVISEMAQTMISNNYEVLPVLDQLFKSEHFYDVSLRGTLIRNPLEFLFGIFNATQTVPNFDLTTDSEMYLTMYWLAETMGLAYATPPSVAGWTAYYQAPAFSKLWINSTHIKTRFDVSAGITVYTGIPVGSNSIKVNALGFLDALSMPSDAPTVIDDMCDVFCPKPVGSAQKQSLKLILTNGLPDFEWTIQYSEYQSNIGNTTYSDPVKQRVEFVLSSLFRMPEFQTI
jgi:uncharacterized protein (DUF1800 family)